MEAKAQAKPKQNGNKPKGKNPSFPFYTGDWMKDPELRSVSAEARGLWIDLLCLMWDAPRRGYLVATSGLPFRAEHISRMTGVPQERVVQLLGEMEEVGLFSKDDETGAIYNRRMARKGHISQVRAEAGSKGGSKAPSKTEANDEATPQAKDELKRLPSSSSSLSGERERENTREDFVEIPSKTEVKAFAANGAGVPADFVDWWFSKREHKWGWQRDDGLAINWKRALADDWASMKHKWRSQSKGSGNANNQQIGRNRNDGTQNAGKAPGYAALEERQRQTATA